MYIPLGEALNRGDDEDRGDDGVEDGVTESHQVHYHTTGHDREEVRWHGLPEVEQEIFHLWGGGGGTRGGRYGIFTGNAPVYKG